ncbi:hypothetical protein ACFWGD_03055 [Corynebacterium sp. NPDC060344]|uniref:hypothetical protein n=1 Tax=Corynebacterium sp. NPDC060344 TaxID=3347101 RepID=UPI003665AFF0
MRDMSGDNGPGGTGDSRGPDGNDGFGAQYSLPKTWKTILAALALILGAAALFGAIVMRGVPGIAIGIALAAGLIVPAAWWLWHENREHRAAVDPDAPAAMLDRRWRFIAPISVVLLAIGGLLAIALPAPDDAATTPEEETSSHRTAPKPSRSSTSKTPGTRSTTTTQSTTTSSSTTSTSSSTSESSDTSETETSTSSSTRPTTPSTRPTSEPTSPPTTEPPTTQPTTPPTTQPPTTQPTEPTQPTQPTQPTNTPSPPTEPPA